MTFTYKHITKKGTKSIKCKIDSNNKVTSEEKFTHNKFFDFDEWFDKLEKKHREYEANKYY